MGNGGQSSEGSKLEETWQHGKRAEGEKTKGAGKEILFFKKVTLVLELYLQKQQVKSSLTRRVAQMAVASGANA